MTEDDVVREVRAAREAFAASHGYDIRAMVTALHDFGIGSGRTVVRLTPRPVGELNSTRQRVEAASKEKLGPVTAG